MIDNFDLITRNITYIAYYLFQFLKDKYSPREIFAIAVRMDADAYVEEESLETSEIFEYVFDLFDSRAIIRDECFISVEEYFDSEDAIWFIDAFSLICVATMALLFSIDNEDMDIEEIYDDISEREDEIKQNVQSILRDEIHKNPDNGMKERIRSFVTENSDFKKWDLELSFLIDEYGKCSIDFDDIDSIFDKKQKADDSKYKESVLLGFVKEVDKMLNHKKEHDDFLRAIESRREEMKEYTLEQFPRLSKSKIEKMYKSANDDELLIAGTCYLYGIVVDTDFEKAYNCFAIGAKNEDPEATYYMSLMYLKSIHVNYDPDYWIKYLALACRLGSEEAISQWDELLSDKKEYYEEKEKHQIDGRTENMLRVIEKQTAKRKSKAPIVFSIIGGSLVLLGVIILATSNSLGLMPIVFGIPFLIIALVMFVRNA